MLLPLQILFSTGFLSVFLMHLQPSWGVAQAQQVTSSASSCTGRLVQATGARAALW